MADDRPVEDPVDQVGRLQQELDDFRATMIARLARRSTGDVEPTIRTVPKADTLICNGQQVDRVEYAALWAWAQEQGLVITGLFTNGNGSTTFGLPNFAGRVPVGVGTLGSDSYALGALGGAATRAIATANLPSHDHNVTVASHATHSHTLSMDSAGSHGHSGSTNSAGSHGGHQNNTETTPGGQFGGLAVNAFSAGNHSHGLSIDSAGSHTHGGDTNAGGPTTHSVTESAIGSGTAFDVRQPTIALNWLVWT